MSLLLEIGQEATQICTQICVTVVKSKHNKSLSVLMKISHSTLYIYINFLINSTQLINSYEWFIIALLNIYQHILQDQWSIT